MGWRFRKVFRLGKHGRINLSKSGIGFSIGGKVVRIGTGPRGTYRSIRIPGTGIYRFDYLRRKRK